LGGYDTTDLAIVSMENALSKTIHKVAR